MLKRIVCLLLLIALLPGVAVASPEPIQFRCALKMTLNVKGILGEPFDRWAQELFALTVPVVEYVAWPEGESLRIDVAANGVHAFWMRLDRGAGKTALQCDLMGDGQVLLRGGEKQDADSLLDNVRAVLMPDTDWPSADCTLTLHAGRMMEQLVWITEMLERWAAQADPQPKETAQGLALLLTTLSGIAGEQDPAAPLLTTFVDYDMPQLVPGEVSDAALDAPDGLLAAITMGVPEALIRALSDSAKL